MDSVSSACSVPFGYYNASEFVEAEGRPVPSDRRRPIAGYNAVGPDYFATMGVSATYMIVGADCFETLRVPVLRWRAFTPAEEEGAGGPPVAVIDEPLAQQLFGQEDPIGRQVQLRRAERQVIGVVRGFRQELRR